MKLKLLLSIILFVAGGQLLFAAAPTIASFSPNSGSVGTVVTITGTNLGSITAFSIGGKPAVVAFNGTNSLVGVVMPGAVSGAITVTTSDGTVNSTNTFTVLATSYPSTQNGGKFVGGDSFGQPQGGCAVAMSADGHTAVVGGLQDNNTLGAVWIYYRSGSTWTQGPKLVGTGTEGSPANEHIYEGGAVAVSADGHTVAVGGDGDNGNAGAVWIFVADGGIWQQQAPKLVGTGAIGDAGQGMSVALSADGNTLVEGGYFDNNYAGALWCFTRTGTSWTQLGNKFAGTGTIGNAGQGDAVALSADGKTLVEGGELDNNKLGAAWVFRLTDNTWIQLGTKLVGTGYTRSPGFTGVTSQGSVYQGSSVAINADGTTVLIGGNSDNDGIGGAWAYTFDSINWNQQGGKFAATGGVGTPGLGNSVALSADGNTALLGGYFDNNYNGAAWVFTRNAGSWGQVGSKLVGSLGIGTQQHQGASVALSGDGANAVVGGTGDNNYIGATWFYTAAVVLQSQTIHITQPNSVVYGAADVNPGGTSTSGLPVSYASSNTAVATVVNGKLHITGAGSTTITATQAGDATYSAASPVTVTFTVTKAPLTITVQNQYGIAGMALPAFYVAYSGLVYFDTQSVISAPAFSTPASAASSPGSYQVTASGSTAANYNISYVPGILTLVPLSIVTNPFPIKTYGDADFYWFGVSTPAITFTSSNAGVATIVSGKIHITGAGTSNITLSNGAGGTFTKTLTVTKAPLTVTANNIFGVSGMALPALTISYSGFVLGEGTANLTTIPTAITTATLASPAANYPITVSGGSSANYTFIYHNGTLTLVPLSALMTPFPIKTYGDADFYEFGVSTPAETYTSSNPAVAVIINGKIHITGAGTTTISIRTLNKTLTVHPAVLTAIADNQTKLVGSLLPQLTIHYVGFVNGDTPASLTTQPVGATTATASSPAGSYAITVSGGSSPNYTLQYTAGTLVVTASGSHSIEPQVQQALSPNGDAVNDALTINNITSYPENTFTVINSAGASVYQTKGYNNTTNVFTGHSKTTGKLVPKGTYFYQLQYKNAGVVTNKTGYLVVKY